MNSEAKAVNFLRVPPVTQGQGPKLNYDFDPISILRGAELTVVGAIRALHNPDLFRSKIYRQAGLAICAGLLIRVAVEIPVQTLRVLVWMVSSPTASQGHGSQSQPMDSVEFIVKTLLQLPYLLMGLLNIYLISPHLDDVFMRSLDWVDRTYVLKHQHDDPTKLRPIFFPNLQKYPIHTSDATKPSRSPLVPAQRFLSKFLRRISLSLIAYAFSFVPVVGRFSLPLVSFWTLKTTVGSSAAGLISVTSVVLPRRYLVAFLQAYHGSRSLMKELLRPYLKRIGFTREQQANFFRAREGLFFGFAFGFYIFLKTPVFGVLIYGIAEASTAYLITKAVQPPPPPEQRAEYAVSQTAWTNKKDPLLFLGAFFDQYQPQEGSPKAALGRS